MKIDVWLTGSVPMGDDYLINGLFTSDLEKGTVKRGIREEKEGEDMEAYIRFKTKMVETFRMMLDEEFMDMFKDTKDE